MRKNTRIKTSSVSFAVACSVRAHTEKDMNLDYYCQSVKTRFPEVSARADKLYDSYWHSYVEMEFFHIRGLSR